MPTPTRPVLARRIFWDVDFDKLDYDGKAGFIIERVFERGDVEDIRQCRRYYGDEKVMGALLSARSLKLDTLHFVSALFKKPLEAFRCYALRQSNPELFPY
ncbi:MAG: hypothetical protein KF797_00610 [Flavobacteriales bacterium]|nr:hypothetical protein [Flavobacteriales bacterium]